MSTYYDENELDDNVPIKGNVLKRLFGALRPHWKPLLGGVLAIVVVSLLDAYFTILSKRIIDEGILLQDKAAVLRFFGMYGAIVVVQAVGVFFFIFLVGVQGEGVRYELRKQLFNHLQQLSLSYFSNTPLGWIMSRVTSDTEKMAELLTWGIIDTTYAAVSIVVSAVFMFSINWQLALIVLLSLPAMMYAALKFRTRIYHHYRLSRKANSKMTASLNENITGVRVVKALRREDRNLQDFKVLSTAMYRSSYRAAYLSALFQPTIQVISAVSLGLILWRGGIKVELGSMTIGGLQAFVSYIMMILWPIQDLARVYADMQNAVASSERVFSLIDTQPGIHNRPDAVSAASLAGDIDFEGVSFRYEEDEPVIQNLSFHIPYGQTVALVGPTGGGKTTIVNLLCRFYEPTEGVIRIAGTDYLNLTLETIQSRIGVVLQTPHLFSGSIRENIRYGKLDATDEEVEDAAKLAGAHNFITHFEHAYEQNVGEGGNLLSVGQKQLISIARAILSNPDIFVMDEATSSVDTLTEALIQNGMEKLMTGRTSFIIAHRLSTIKNADVILVIRDGQIAESGNHKSLMLLKGHYYKLYTQQFRHELETQLDPYLDAPAVPGLN
ncbi:MAG TPA: ABC transporter ATP-binding protein [Anaerolineaceae bacterium]|nr:ABC transporter ATP-binding protein/permease [Anaerolineales bacterium]HOG58018.1 ABC transporter ATP-binding protein [Anaerolineaceae bacterium]HOR83862.1 ABC transporter ATP-binding protein [Anaerolineaceae bacterium]HPL42614.1 ABC transporter ATP-binding protein [Anaerolineaceae bacterium]HPY33025.1 ABC transporter ATP-binding protein [Anaerolineaceae bacterium]